MAEKPFSADEIDHAVRVVVDELIQETALAALSSVIVGTPVGDPTLWQYPERAPPGYVGGHARRNWRVSTLGFDASVKGEEGKGGGQSAATQEALGDGTRAIRGFTVDAGALYIFNNVPYIARLNAGWSTQAPANFVERAVQAATQVQGFTREVIP